jgi:PAS domain S-box-containing protein
VSYAQLLENVEDAVITVDEQMAITTWSRAAERMYGWAGAEVLGHHVERFVRLDMTAADRAANRCRVAEAGRSRLEAVAFRRDGTPFDVELINVATTDGDGQLTGFLGIHRDITERKRFEREQLRTVEIVRASSELIGMASLDGRVIFLNDAGQRLVGLDGAAAVAGTEVLDYFAPEDRDFVRERIFPVILKEGRWAGECFGEFEIRLRNFQTGEPIPVFWDGFRLDDPHTGEPFGLGTVARDITESKRSEAIVRESQRQTVTILESITDSFYAVDRDWRLTYVNERAVQAFAALLGEPQRREELLGQDIWDLFPVVIGTAAYEHYHRAMREQRTVVFEYRYPDGPWLDVRAYPSEHGLSVYFRDITDRKRAEQERELWVRDQALIADLGLRALASERLEPLMEEAVAVVARALDVDLVGIAEILPGRTALVLRAGVGWSDGAVGSGTGQAGRGSLVGYTVEAGVPVVSDDIRSDDRFDRSPLLAAHRVVSAVSVVIGGRDEPFGALGAFCQVERAFSDDDVNFVQAIANVVATAVQRSESETRVNDARESERRRIARDLHDEALHGLTDALVIAGRAQSASDDPETAESLAAVVPALKRVGQQLRAAVYDLRLEGEEDRSFSELLSGLVEVHRGMAARCDVRLEVLGGLPAEPLGAPGAGLLRIVGEALTNARRHSGAHTITVTASGSPALLVVEVADDGGGFDAAADASPIGRAGIKGMRERAADLGAELTVASRPGDGTRVRLELALAEQGAVAAQAVRILLVEDHAAVREAVASAFEREPGFEVVGQAASLAEARGMLARVDVAVIDLGLPDGYGADLIPELREASPRAQALVLSGALDRAEVARAVHSGAAGALSKTVHLQQVVHAVRRLRAGETLLPVAEVVELLQYAGRRREEERSDRLAIARLTAREREVLQALAEGLDSQQMADRLYITLRTQRNHVSNILAKLGVHSQLQALVFALRYGLVEIR